MSPKNDTKSSILNFGLYQAGWFACVLGAAGGWADAGATLALGIVAVHLLFAARPGHELPVLLAALGLGLVLDTLHGAVGVLDFAAHESGSPAPLWVLALWLQFATALHFSMNWLSRRYVLASVLGLIGGPLAFLGGERLGAAVFGEPRALALLVLGLSWSVAMPLLVFVADRFPGEGRYRLPWRNGVTGRWQLGPLPVEPVREPLRRG